MLVVWVNVLLVRLGSEMKTDLPHLLLLLYKIMFVLHLLLLKFKEDNVLLVNLLSKMRMAL